MRCITQADAVDMASIMKYVVNNLNQIPTYCFAEENLMPENCCKATSTEEKHETPLIPSGPTCSHYDNHHQPVRPPPGFPPFTEQRVPSNGAIPSIRNFQNCYSFANTSNISNTLNTNASISGDVGATNPFLTDQQFISNDIAKQIYMSTWNENKKLQISIIEILNVLMERLSLSVKDHIQLNKILKIIEKVLLEQKDNHSTKTPSNLVNGTTLNDIDSAQKVPYNLNSETVVNQEFNVNTFSMSNPFGINSGDKPQSNAMFSTYDGLAFKNNWSQSNEFSSPSSTTANPSSFINSENIPLMMPAASTMPANTSTSNNFSECLDSINTQFANMLKDTNPFKTSIIDGTQIPETRNERTANNYDADIASYLSTKNPQSNALETEIANIHARSNCFTPVSNVEYVSENYTPKIVYESGPIMYNTQKKQTDTDANARQNACSNNFSVELGQYDKNSALQPANDIAASQHIVINHKTTKDNSQVDENYITQQATHYVQDLQSIINSEATYYQQNGNVDNLRPVSSQVWNQTEIPEYCANSKFQNSVPLLNHNENTNNRFCTPLSCQDWNRDNDRKSIPRETNEATNLSYVFEVKDNHDKERPMDTYANSWYNTKNESVQNMNATCSSSFVFQKIGTILLNTY